MADKFPLIDSPEGFSHRQVQTNGIRLHYVEEGSGPLVILLHGFPYLWYMWRRQIRALAAAAIGWLRRIFAVLAERCAGGA